MISPRVILAMVCAVLACGLVSATEYPPATWNPAAPNTPANGANVNDVNVRHCLISELKFSGLNLIQIGGPGDMAPGFKQNHFTYACTCDANFEGTTFTPLLLDSGSSAEVIFNGVTVHSRRQGNAISNTGLALTAGAKASPLKVSSFMRFKTGMNTIIIGVGCNGQANPDCFYQYKLECNKPPTPGSSVTGDPQFVGLRGQSYQVHGVSGEVYNIVSDADVQYNSRFVFLNSGACPVVNGIKQKACYSHPGSYLGELGLKTRAGDRIHLVSGSAKAGFASVTVNGKELEQGETIVLAEEMGSVSRNSTHLSAVQIGNWDFVFENSDMFVNQRVRVLDARSLRSHGLLGQTWRETTYPNAVKHIQGAVDDYVIRSNDVFGDDFLFNAFD